MEANEYRSSYTDAGVTEYIRKNLTHLTAVPWILGGHGSLHVTSSSDRRLTTLGYAAGALCLAANSSVINLTLSDK